MAYEKKTWKNKEEIPESELSQYPRFDAENMNRIEGGIEEALALTPDDIGALAKTKHIQNTDILSITEEGFYYSVLSKNIPTTEVAGYVRVIVASYDYRVVCWRPYNSLTEYTNVFKKGTWLGWIETFTSSGGALTGHLDFKNLDSYYAFKKGRTVAGVVHNVSIGVSSNGASTMEHYTGDVLDGRLELMPVANDNSNISAWTNNINALVLRENSSGAKKAIFGEHNKRSGHYTGNGEASRAIQIGGICPCLLVSWERDNIYWSVIVTVNGGFGVQGSGTTGTNSYSPSGEARIGEKDGVRSLILGTNKLNHEGVVYYYQSL